MENLVTFLLTALFFFFQTSNFQDLTCSRPTPPDNAYIYTGKRKLKEKYGLNQVVMFRCKIGNGASFMQCITSGWSQITNLQCLPIECRDPGRPVNGARYPNRNKYVFKDRIRFQCKTNYTLSGFPSITCQQDKRWSGNVPRCLEACLRPNKYPVNGGIRGSYSSYRHKYSIRYYCNRGYNLVGREYVRCLNGTWENKQPTCRPIECRDSGRPVNGGRYPDRNKYVFKDKIDFQCNTNYTLRGDSSITCQQDKIWSGNVPKCLAPCKDPGIPNNGHRLDHSFLHNASVRFSCRRGWNMQGYQTITCNDGNWDRTTPVCMECGSALGMENGKIPDSNIQASSTRWIYHAKYGRLNGRYAWCSGVGRDPYLQIDFGKPYRITGLATQGSAYDNKWVENYTVTSNLAGSSFNIYREDKRDKIFTGNRDSGSVVKNKLSNPVIARRLRIYPQKQGGFSYFNPACVRVEIYGCDLPSDCILIGSRVIVKWNTHVSGGYQYLKAYLTSISTRYWRVELEDESHGRPRYKYLLKYEELPFVLDVPPKHEELQVGTRVLAPWGHTYYTGTIKTTRDRYYRYRVRADDGNKKNLTIDEIRLLKAPTFCT